MDKQLIDDLYNDLDKRFPKGSDGVYLERNGLGGCSFKWMEIGSFHYEARGPKITDCNALKFSISKGGISITSFQKKDQYKSRNTYGHMGEDDRYLHIWVDSILPGLDVKPVSGLKKEVLEFMKIYGYHFCETLYPEDMGANEIEYKKSCGDWHGAEGEEERFLAYNPYEEHEGADRYWDFYIKKN